MKTNEKTKTELNTKPGISHLLPTLGEVSAAITEISKKSTAPDKETPDWMENDIKNGINWALNYVTKKSQENNNSGQSEKLVCPDCKKYKRMQGNGIIHQLCECGE